MYPGPNMHVGPTRYAGPITDTGGTVGLGRTDLVDDSTILAEMTYEHPIYTTESVAAQALLPDIESDRIVFAGAYHGWGFHEDGAASGERAARRLADSLHRVATESVALQDDPT